MHRTEDLHPVLRGMQADSNTLPRPTPYEYREGSVTENTITKRGLCKTGICSQSTQLQALITKRKSWENIAL